MRVISSVRCLVAIPIAMAVLVLSNTPAPGSAEPAAGAAGPTLVLPFRSVGVSDTTIAVVRDLLAGELESRGVSVVARMPVDIGSPTTEIACDEQECARKLAEDLGAGQVVFGTLSKLGEKVVVRVRSIRVQDTNPSYSEQISSTSVEDLDVVVRRIAEGIVSGRHDSSRATIESVTSAETERPRRREGRSGLGFRAGLLWPSGNSYGGANHLTDLHLAWGFEGRRFLVETTTLMGLRWGGGTVDWTLLDLFGARLFGMGDVATYVGGGLGVHAINVERKSSRYYPDYGSYGEYGNSESATALTADVGGGVILLRTYSMRIVIEARYHHVFEDFAEVNKKGAHGLVITFGTSY